MEILLDFVHGLTGPWPYLIVFVVLLACGFGLPVPEDITLFVAGLMSYFGKSDVFMMIVIAMAGVLIGDGTIFLLGAKYGRQIAGKGIFKKILHPERFAAIKGKFHDHGNKIIFGARFMPGLRTPIFFSAGTMHIPFRVFLFYDGFAALISVPAIVYSTYYFGDRIEQVISVVRRVENGITIGVIAVAAFFFVRWFLKHRKKKNEALLSTPVKIRPSSNGRRAVTVKKKNGKKSAKVPRKTAVIRKRKSAKAKPKRRGSRVI